MSKTEKNEEKKRYKEIENCKLIFLKKVVDNGLGVYYNNLAMKKEKNFMEEKYDVYFYEKARASQP